MHFINLVPEDWSREERMREQGDRCTLNKKDEQGMLTVQLFFGKEDD